MIFDLNMELTRYLNKVIGMKIPIFNEAQPSIMYSSPNKGQVDVTMQLPTTQDTLGDFLTQQWVAGANLKSIRAFLLSATYHEAAHDMSGEIGQLHSTEDRKTIAHYSLRNVVANKIQPQPDMWVMPMVIMNIVNDVNDYTFSPLNWPGMAAIHGAIGRILYWMGDPIEPLNRKQVKALPPEERTVSEFNRLLRATLWLMRNLRVRYSTSTGAKTIPISDPLSVPFNDIKQLMKDLRREKNPANRERFCFGLYDSMLAHWKWCGGTEDEFREFLNQQSRVLSMPSSIFGQGTSSAMQNSLDSLSDEADKELDKAKPPAGSSRTKTKKGQKGGKGKIKTRPSTLSPHIDQGNMIRLNRSMEAKICERIRQQGTEEASEVGIVLAPIHFTDIYTRPRTARLWRGGEGTQTVLSGHVVGVWDRSGSMDERSGSYTKADITKETVCTMHAAITAQNRIRIDHIPYDHETERLQLTGMNLQEQLKRLAGSLSPRGGTDAARAIHEANQIFKEVHSQRRLMIIVTDGDLWSHSYSIDAEVEEAKRRRVDICVIGLGTTVDHIRGMIPEDNIFVIDDAMELPEIIDGLILSRT